MKEEMPTAKTEMAYEKLQKMIGLTEPKEIAENIIAFRNFEMEAKRRRHWVERGNYNLVLSGNPGSGKTEFARVFSDILFEIGVTSKRGCVEVGRDGLVGKYVGHSEDKCLSVIKEAYGKVLFIDEAYSLDDGDRDPGSFGNKVIEILIREMENHQKDLIVIVAGYKDRMETFLSSNPGLRSRFGYFIDFPDYSTEELIKISHFIAKEKGFSLEKKAEKKLMKIFDEHIHRPDFGNGRFARKVIEQAILKHAKNFLYHDNVLDLSDDMLFTLTSADVEMPKILEDDKRVIGFRNY